MRALLAITVRELRERWTLPFALFVGGFVLLFLVRYVDITARPLATMAAVPSAWGIALLMGGSVISRDLADGRLGFYFSRPVPWWSIAGGKLAAALLMAIVAPIAAVLPAMIFDWNPAKDAEGIGQLLTGGSLALMLTLLLGLVCFGHVAGVVYRARSTWAAADFVLFGLCVWGGVWLFYAFKRLGLVWSHPTASHWVLVPLFLLVAAVPFTAAVVHVAVGRSDMERGHRALSLTFWAGVLVWFAVLAGLLVRERAVTPAALATRSVWGAAPDGRLVGISGATGHGGAAFAYDTASGRALRLGLASWPALSADGRHVAWLEEPPFWRRDRATEIQLARLADAGFEVDSVELASRLSLEGSVSLVLAPQADRLAVVQQRTLSVFELPSGRALSSSSASDGDWMAAAFLPDGQLRAFRRVRPAVGPPGAGIVSGRIEVVSLKGGVPESATRLDAVGHALLGSPAGGDLVLLQEPPNRYSLHDPRTGRLVRTFSGEDGFQVGNAQLLDDGVVALVETRAPARRLRLAREGQPDRVTELPQGAAFASAGPQGLLAVARFDPARGRLAGETLFFSSDAAEPRGREPGLLPAFRFAPWLSDRTASQFFVSDSGELVRLDPTTRERRVLLPAPPAAR